MVSSQDIEKLTVTELLYFVMMLIRHKY